MNYAALSEPFPKQFIDTVRKGSRSESYVNHAVVSDRLNRVHPNHTIELLHVERYEDAQGMPHCAGVWVRLTVDGVYRDEVGTVGRASNYGDEIKACMSDALKRAAMRFGVAIQLWHELPTGTAGKDRPPASEGTEQRKALDEVRVDAGSTGAGGSSSAQEAVAAPCAHLDAVTTLPSGRPVPPGKAYCPACNHLVAA